MTLNVISSDPTNVNHDTRSYAVELEAAPELPFQG